MKISGETLLTMAEETGFRQEVVEKVIHLISLLNAIQSHPFLRGKLILKGGTALNLFIFNVPRLSVDIDLNYVGAIDRDTMVKQRPEIEKALEAVCSRENLAVLRIPGDHAGGKWRLRYENSFGQNANLELDINYMFRIPLWPETVLDSNSLGVYQAENIPVINIYELTAGKMAALLARMKSRDLYDVFQLLTTKEYDVEILRLAFVLYGAMNRKDWRTITLDDIDLDINELKNSLVPMLRDTILRDEELNVWGERLVNECRAAMGCVLPLKDTEMEFLDRLNRHGEIAAKLLTEDEELADKIEQHPMLLWKALNVRNYRNK